MRIEIICTGDEVLTGKIVNTNYNPISQKLEDVGLRCAGARSWATTARRSGRRSGGPASAPTRSSSMAASAPRSTICRRRSRARAAGVDLVLSEEWLTRMEALFRRRSRIMPPNNRKQAMLPDGAEILDNPIGTACGFALEIGRARVSSSRRACRAS